MKRQQPKMYESLAQFAQHETNFVPLTPIYFLSRTADVFGHLPSLVYEDKSYTWAETHQRCQKMAKALCALGIDDFSTVSLLTFNTPEMFEAHFYVPLAGAVLNTINTRLDAATIEYILDFAETRVLIVDRELVPQAMDGINKRINTADKFDVIVIDDPHAKERPNIDPELTYHDYQQLLDAQDYDVDAQLAYTVDDELAPLSINFTSGTSGQPKGVVYHHRGSYLMTMGTIAGWPLPMHPNYLYTVPMFHCNGWGHAWTMTAMAAKVVCLRYFEPLKVFDLIEEHQISHFGGAPVVLNMMANAKGRPEKLNVDHTIYCMTAGAPPPAAVLESMAQLGFEIMHVYGLTESYGHILQATPQPEWHNLKASEVAELKARQGVRFPQTESVLVVDSDSDEAVPADGETYGEIVIRGNTMMTGYLKDAQATSRSFERGWFRSGDLAVVHPDGYIQVKDRAKDIIISGGENISSVEIENALYKHPAIGNAAVVAMDDDKWGEVPCAFVELKPEFENDDRITEEALIEHCTNLIARFKRPKRVVFMEIPKTATGKVQKYALRQWLNDAN